MTDVAAAVRPFDAERALIAVVNDYVFVDKIYSRDASGMGQAGTFWTPLAADTR